MKTWVTGSLILVNTLVATYYLWLAQGAWWMEPELREIPGASGGGPIIWFFPTAYILGAVVIVDAAACGVHFWRARRRKSGTLSAAGLIVVPLWVIVIAIDFAHH